MLRWVLTAAFCLAIEPWLLDFWSSWSLAIAVICAFAPPLGWSDEPEEYRYIHRIIYFAGSHKLAFHWKISPQQSAFLTSSDFRPSRCGLFVTVCFGPCFGQKGGHLRQAQIEFFICSTKMLFQVARSQGCQLSGANATALRMPQSRAWNWPGIH